MYQMKRVIAIGIVGLTVGACFAGVAAPSTLSNAIVGYRFWAAGLKDYRAVLYSPGGHYAELFVTKGSIEASESLPPHVGVFTYTVDPKDVTHATITYDGGATIANDELYFGTATTGSEAPSNVSGSSVGFTLYPRQDSSGGSNFSSRMSLSAGGLAITGFVVSGSSPRWVLLRAVGASLVPLGVSSTVSHPTFTLYDGKQQLIDYSAAWSSDQNYVPGYQTVFSMVGAFPLLNNSDEGVVVVALAPGAYTAVFKASSSGEILTEGYVLPY